MSSNNSSYTPDELRAMALNLFLTSKNGVVVQTEELRRQAARVSVTLHVLAFFQSFLAIALWVAVLGLNLTQKSPVMVSAEMLTVISALFWFLHYWSFHEPLPAAIVGLIVYLALSIVGVIALFRAPQAARAGSMLLYVPLLRLFVVGYLLRAIIAGVRHRRLRKQAPVDNTHPAQLTPSDFPPI